MALPTKIMPDAIVSFTNETLADLDPHVAGSPTGRHMFSDREQKDVTTTKGWQPGTVCFLTPERLRQPRSRARGKK